MGKLPVARQNSILGALIVIIIMTIVGVGVILVMPIDYKIPAFFVVILFFFLYNNFSAKLYFHSLFKGIRFLRKKRFDEAIPLLEMGFARAQKHQWLDKYRYVLFLNPSKISIREIALIDIAYSYEQMGNGSKAIEYYEKTLEMFPESLLAKAGMNKAAAYENQNKE